MRPVPPYNKGPILMALPAHMSKGLGRIMVADAALHWCTKQLNSDLLRIDHGFGRLVLKPVKTSEQFKMAISLLNAWGPTIKPTISVENVLTKIIACENERNALAHGVWRKYPDGYRLLRIKGKRKTDANNPNPEWDNLEFLFLPKSDLIAKEHFRAWHTKIREARRLVERLRREVNAALKAWPPINPEQPPGPVRPRDRKTAKHKLRR